MTLHELLDNPSPDVARIVLRQQRRWSFRWMFLVELLLVVLFLLCLIPLALLVALIAGSDVFEDFSLEKLARRAWRYHQEIQVQLLGPNQTEIGRAVARPRDSAEADALVRSVLVAADGAGITVVHTVGGGISAHLGTWYGGQPLLTAPSPRNADRARRALERAGVRIDETDDMLTVVVTDTARPAWKAVLFLIFGAPFFVWTARGRQDLAEAIADLRGQPPRSLTVEVRADEVHVVEQRGQTVLSRFDVDGAELLAIAHQPVIRDDRELSLGPARPRIWSHRGVRDLPLFHHELGPAIADFLTEAVLELRDRHPESALPGREPRRARCPYCATVYKIVLTARCPSCGAPPEILVGPNQGAR